VDILTAEFPSTGSLKELDIAAAQVSPKSHNYPSHEGGGEWGTTKICLE